MKKITFIASYMKSGNTWVRSIICSLLNNGNFKLEDLKKIKLFSQEIFFSKLDNPYFQKDGNLDFNFVSKNWIKAQQIINNSGSEEVKFFKTHSARGLINGNYFTDKSVCKGFVYLIRDPRDICISLSKHMNIDIDKAIDIMLFQNNFVTSVFKVNEAVCTWRNHLESWVNFNSVPKLILKYEDMILNQQKTIEQISIFLNLIHNNELNINSQIIEKTMKNTSFNNLQNLEKTNGFIESTNNNFFRKGKADQWKNILSKDQIKIIESNLKTTMLGLGYL